MIDLVLDSYGDILSLNELCEVLKISENIAYGLIKDKSISAFRIGHVWKIPKQCIIDYINTEIKASSLIKPITREINTCIIKGD